LSPESIAPKIKAGIFSHEATAAIESLPSAAANSYGNRGKKMPDISLLGPEPQNIAQLTIMFGGDDCNPL
jgi:hypothetical protein